MTRLLWTFDSIIRKPVLARPAPPGDSSFMKRTFLQLLLCAIAVLPAIAVQEPNIIVIVADDLGYADTGFQGAKDIETPHLDALAKSGVRFTNGYSSHPFCSPMRAGFMTGRYQQRFGYETNVPYDPHNSHIGLPKDQRTIAQRLKTAGLRTAAIGKWHLGASAAHHPLARGFDFHFGFLGGGHDYFEVDLARPMAEGYRLPLEKNGRPEPMEGYLTDVLSEAAADFIKGSQRKPFFLYLAYNAPHTPLQAPDFWLEKYASIGDEKRRIYAAMVSTLDAGVGRVLETLEAVGLREKTVVFFVSDNGGPEHANASDNGVLRGQKGEVYEGGVRVPFLMSWPGVVEGGRTFDHPVNTIDVACTTLALAGVKIEGDETLDGVNLMPFVTGENKSAPHDAIFWRKVNGEAWAVRSGKWKLLRASEAEPTALYDLDADITEYKDVSEANPEVVAELEAKFDAWNSQNEVCSQPNAPDYHKRMDVIYREMIAR